VGHTAGKQAIQGIRAAAETLKRACIGKACRGMPDGSKIRIVVTE